MPDDPIKIIVVDDDPDLRDLLIGYLAREGYEVTGAQNGRALDAALEQCGCDLILLDLMLPGEDGLSIARRLRQASQIPIIMLSARGEDVDRIVGLEVGADDYVSKPFNPRELLARIRAVLRRREPGAAQSANTGEDPDDQDSFDFGPYHLDMRTHELLKEGEPVPLTGGELNLLAVLAAHPNRVLDRDRLLDLLKGYERSPFDRSIDVQIARLRAKIEPDTKRPRYIRTVWGKGYMFTPLGES